MMYAGSKRNGRKNWRRCKHADASREHLQTANQIKQAIGDPVAAIALIDTGCFRIPAGFSITDTLTESQESPRKALSYPNYLVVSAD